jgi:hypothetical protein
MDEHIHTHSATVVRDGTAYEAQVHGTERSDGTWSGWLEFRPARGSGPVLRTDQETSQPSRRALEYWAGGLEPVYLDGALVRACRTTQRTNTNAKPTYAPPQSSSASPPS